MKRGYGEIVNIASIGARENPFLINDLLNEAGKETLRPAAQDQEKVLALGIDFQNSFMDNGELGVPGAHKDVENFSKFIYDNAEGISQIALTIDTHKPFQIFHPCWFINDAGEHPAPFTLISAKDIEDGKWKPVIYPVETLEYCRHLEADGKKILCIWTYHCLQGTFGHAIENQLMNMVYYHSVAKKTTVQTIVKGTDPLTEMYGAIKPEYDPKNTINTDFLNKIAKFDKIFIGGEAKSHCVYETIKQILEYYETKPQVTKKIYILEDCMSSIPGFETATEAAFDEFKRKYGVNIIKSTDVKLS